MDLKWSFEKERSKKSICPIDFHCHEYIAPFHTIFPLILSVHTDSQKKEFPFCLIVKILWKCVPYKSIFFFLENVCFAKEGILCIYLNKRVSVWMKEMLIEWFFCNNIYFVNRKCWFWIIDREVLFGKDEIMLIFIVLFFLR